MTKYLIIFAIAYLLVSCMLMLVVVPEVVKDRLQTYTLLGKAVFIILVLLILPPMIFVIVLTTILNIVFKKGKKHEDTD